MSVEPTAEQLRESIRREDEQLARIVSFIEQGVLGARITEENGELLILAAERAHTGAVRPLRRQLSDRLREEWQA